MSFQGGPYNQSGSNMVTFGKACRIVRVMLVTNHDQFKSNGRWPNRLALRKGWTTKTSCKSCDFVWLSFEETFLLTVQIIIMKKKHVQEMSSIYRYTDNKYFICSVCFFIFSKALTVASVHRRNNLQPMWSWPCQGLLCRILRDDFRHPLRSCILKTRLDIPTAKERHSKQEEIKVRLQDECHARWSMLITYWEHITQVKVCYLAGV